MKCRICQSEIPDYLTGELGPSTRGSVARHLSECRNCESIADDLRAALPVLYEEKQTMRKMPGRVAFSVGVNERIDGASRRGTRSILLTRVLAPAAALSLCVVLAFVALHRTPAENEESALRNGMREIITDMDTMQLADLQDQLDERLNLPGTVELVSAGEIILPDVQAPLPSTIFNGLEYSDVLAGCSDFLTQDEIIELMTPEHRRQLLGNTGQNALQ
jgi:hypothetical protein